MEHVNHNSCLLYACLRLDICTNVGHTNALNFFNYSPVLAGYEWPTPKSVTALPTTSYYKQSSSYI